MGDNGIVPQEMNLAAFSEPEQDLSGRLLWAQSAYKFAKQRAELDLRRLWQKRHAKVLMLSGGMKRRLLIARAFMPQPKLLILDEPTAGLDIELRDLGLNFLVQINQQVACELRPPQWGGRPLTTHSLEEAEMLCRTVALIDQGCVKEQKSMGHVAGFAPLSFI